MSIVRQIRPVAAAAVLALAVLSAPGLQGVASARDLCTPETCGTHTCMADGKYYRGGESVTVTLPDGRVRTYMCDGFTGNWIEWSQPSPTSGTTAPPPTTKQK